MEEWTPVEVMTGVFLGLGVVAGAAYGALGVGTVPAVIGGAAIFGVFALVLVTLVAFVVAAVAWLFRPRGDR